MNLRHHNIYIYLIVRTPAAKPQEVLQDPFLRELILIEPIIN